MPQMQEPILEYAPPERTWKSRTQQEGNKTAYVNVTEAGFHAPSVVGAEQNPFLSAYGMRNDFFESMWARLRSPRSLVLAAG